ncbi:UNVERIFIED_ORG: hypothetical protein J2W65_002786 [Pseudomonas parafulva]|nr:hypothetical protein [Pseudomonas parafulva]
MDRPHRQPTFFHVMNAMLEEGSVILPGNWGRSLRLYTGNEANAMLYREHVLEQIRSSEFPDKPSRLNCIFLLRTLEEAIRYRNAYSGFGVIHEVSVNASHVSVHFGDYNFAASTARIEFLEGMPKLAREYWSIVKSDTVEVLFPGSVTVVRRHDGC